LGKHAGMYKSEKRKKELKRQKKKEEKRQKRLQKDSPFQQEGEIAGTEETSPQEVQGTQDITQ
jgi:hypothetical protein